MKKSNYLLLPLLTLMLLLAFACKKKTSPSSPDAPETPETPAIPSNPSAEVKPLTPLSISSENLKIDFQYASTGNFLTEIRQSNGTREMIVYNDKMQLKEYKRYLKDDLLYHVYYVLNDDGLVAKAIQYTLEAGGKLISPLGYYQITYDDKMQMEAVDWYDFKNMLIKTREFNYDDNLLFTGSRTNGIEPLKQSYTYDENSGVFKQVPQLQPLSLENEAFYFLNVKSNLKTMKTENQPGANISFEMQYNINGYPSTITQTDAAGKNKSYKITYR